MVNYFLVIDEKSLINFGEFIAILAVYVTPYNSPSLFCTAADYVHIQQSQYTECQ